MSARRLFYSNNGGGAGVPFALGVASNLGALGAATFTRADLSTCASYVDAASVTQYAAANVLRDGHYVAGVRTVLLEETRQNRALWSQDLAQAGGWTITQGSASSPIVAPDGTTSAKGIIATAVNAVHFLVNTAMTISAGNTVTYTFSGKAGTETAYIVYISNAGSTRYAGAKFNMATGAITAAAAPVGYSVVSSSAVLIGSYYLCQLTVATVTDTSIKLLEYVRQETAWTGDGTSTTVTPWGHDVEVGTFATSYIPTGAATVVRAVDALSCAGVPLTGTLFYHYWDLATRAWADAVAVYAASTAIVPPVNRAYSHIAVVQGTRTAAQCKAILGGYFP